MNPQIRRRALREWRGLPQPTKAERCIAIADGLAQLLPKLGLQDRVDAEDIAAAWTNLVGDFFAAHSIPCKLQAGVLLVRVAQPSVLYELERFWKQDVLRKLQTRFGAKKIRSIRFSA